MTSKTSSTAKQPKHILKLTTQEKRDFLDSFDRVFSDVDGVLWNLTSAIENAAQGYKLLKNAGKQVNFITNNSVRSLEDYQKKFKSCGLDVDLDELIHPADSIVRYLKSINFEGLIYMIACERFKNIIKEAGYQIIDGPTKIIHESFTDMASHVFTGEPVRAVIIDVDFNLSSVKLIRAHLFLRNPECLLIAGATDMLLPVAKDVDIVGPGPFAKVLADSSKKCMIALGKPGKNLAEMLIKRYNITETQRTLMIGDMLEQDVSFGTTCGFQTLLVLSGGCNLQQLETETNEAWIPDYYADGMVDFIEFMKDVNKANV